MFATGRTANGQRTSEGFDVSERCVFVRERESRLIEENKETERKSDLERKGRKREKRE